MDTLFLNTQETKTPLIVLIDASGSVRADFLNGQIVFNRMKDILKTLPNNDFRFVFWNSDNDRQIQDDKFKKGLYMIPYVIKKNTIDFTFQHLMSSNSITSSCLTMTYLGFENIPEDWFDKTGRTRICLLTDGQMGYNNIPRSEMSKYKDRLRDSIIKVCQDHVDVMIDIITVEPKYSDFNSMESLSSAAGSDIYNVITSNHLTKYVSRFVSYTRNNLEGHTHINRVTAPTGFLPYGDQYFSELRIGEFIKYLTNRIQTFNLPENTSQKDDLYLKEIQKLSVTIGKLVNNKPPNVKRDIIGNFCTLFKDAPFDYSFIKFILIESIENENKGSAQLLSQYKDSLKTLYSQANNMLVNNVFDAVGINNKFMTLPYNNKIFVGSSRMVTQDISFNKGVYKTGGIDVSNHKVPALPLDHYDRMSQMNEQCLRQYTRAIVNKITGIPIVEDKIIYLVLGYVLVVVMSDTTPEVKDAYRNLGLNMLKKKSSLPSSRQINITELENLENGELPVPSSGQVNKFYECMEIVKQQLGIPENINYMTVWYAICLALNYKTLALKQLLHCKDYIATDFPNINPENLLRSFKGVVTTSYTVYTIPMELLYEYSCLITLDDTTAVGGMRILPHNNTVDSQCYPMYVLSTHGYQQLVENKQLCICPICYKQLDEADFETVGPKPKNIIGELFKEDDVKYFSGSVPALSNQFASMSVSKRSGSSSTTVSNPYKFGNKMTIKPPKDNLLLIMKGTVGAGKSTISRELKDVLEVQGIKCIVEGVDQYCVAGMTPGEAVGKVKENLQSLVGLSDDDKVVVIIDTCGENSGRKTVEYFNVDFSLWNRVIYFPNHGHQSDLVGYMSWTLRNVLQRTKRTPQSTYNLNPEDAGVYTCISVHQKKSYNIFGKKKVRKVFSGYHGDKDSVIQQLDDKADNYQKFLEANMTVEKQVKDIISEHINFTL